MFCNEITDIIYKISQDILVVSMAAVRTNDCEFTSILITQIIHNGDDTVFYIGCAYIGYEFTCIAKCSDNKIKAA